MTTEAAADTTSFDVLLASITTRVEHARFLDSPDDTEAMVLGIVQEVATYILAWEGDDGRAFA